MKSNIFKIIALVTLLVVALPSCRKTAKLLEEQSTVNNESSSLDDDGLPAAPPASKPVLDMAGILSDDDIADITERTHELYDLELAQVAVLIVNDLNGKDCLDYATAVGKKWGVGRKEVNDGITMVIKPKNDQSKGQVAIATGYGMEKILTNEKCHDIIETKMIHLLKEDKYGEAIKEALDEIKEILKENSKQ